MKNPKLSLLAPLRFGLTQKELLDYEIDCSYFKILINNKLVNIKSILIVPFNKFIEAERSFRNAVGLDYEIIEVFKFEQEN